MSKLGMESRRLGGSLDVEISYGDHFTKISDPGLQEFDFQGGGIEADPDAKRAFESFYDAMLEAKSAVGKPLTRD